MKKTVKKRTPYLKINPSAIALACGIFSAAFVLITFITVRYTAVQDSMGLVNFGVARVLLSVLYAFIDGVIIGILFAWLYNKLNEVI